MRPASDIKLLCERHLLTVMSPLGLSLPLRVATRCAGAGVAGDTLMMCRQSSEFGHASNHQMPGIDD